MKVKKALGKMELATCNPIGDCPGPRRVTLKTPLVLQPGLPVMDGSTTEIPALFGMARNALEDPASSAHSKGRPDLRLLAAVDAYGVVRPGGAAVMPKAITAIAVNAGVEDPRSTCNLQFKT